MAHDEGDAMTWVRIDDAAPHHPKLLRAGPDAAWLWVAALAYANRHTTDGVVPDEALSALYPWGGWTRRVLDRLAARLVDVGLWHLREGGGWIIHDYDVYQTPALRVHVEVRREQERVKKQEQRQRKRADQDKDSSGPMRNMTSPSTPKTAKHSADVDVSQGDRQGHIVGTSTRTSPADDPTRPHLPTRPGPARPDPVSSNGNIQTSHVCERKGAVPSPTHEAQGLTVDDLLTALRMHAADRVLLAGADDSRVARALRQRLAELACTHSWGHAELATLAEWYAAGALGWRDAPLGLRELALKPGCLAEHIDAALGWARAGRPTITHRHSETAPLPKSMTTEDFERDAAAGDPLASRVRRPPP